MAMVVVMVIIDVSFHCVDEKQSDVYLMVYQIARPCLLLLSDEVIFFFLLLVMNYDDGIGGEVGDSNTFFQPSEATLAQGKSNSVVTISLKHFLISLNIQASLQISANGFGIKRL